MQLQASDLDKLRLQSLSTPHATTWTLNSPLYRLMTALEVRCGLRLTLGIPQFPSPYLCPDCGLEGDEMGIHAMTCRRSGDISRGHTLLRDTALQLFRQAGYAAEAEQGVPGHPGRRPADILVSGWRGRNLAIDFTIVAPTRASAHPSAASTTTLMDNAALEKRRESEALCLQAGWLYHPFVADCYGAMRCDTRQLVSTLIRNRSNRFFPLNPADVGRAVWSTLSGAAISRAATSLARLNLINNPAGMKLNLLQLQTSRQPATSFCSSRQSLSNANTRSAACVQQRPSMGNITSSPSNVVSTASSSSASNVGGVAVTALQRLEGASETASAQHSLPPPPTVGLATGPPELGPRPNIAALGT